MSRSTIPHLNNGRCENRSTGHRIGSRVEGRSLHSSQLPATRLIARCTTTTQLKPGRETASGAFGSFVFLSARHHKRRSRFLKAGSNTAVLDRSREFRYVAAHANTFLLGGRRYRYRIEISD